MNKLNLKRQKKKKKCILTKGMQSRNIKLEMQKGEQKLKLLKLKEKKDKLIEKVNAQKGGVFLGEKLSSVFIERKSRKKK